jgi:predicted acetylornithine/succinylornithine family transaminase
MTAEQAAAWGATGDHSPLMNNYGSPPRIFVKGSGVELWDKDGNRHLDFLCGLAVTGLGHAHPAITKAIAEQAATLTHTSNLFATEHQAPVAETLDRLIGGPRGQVLFQNSGAEANEAALKLVRKFQGRGKHVIVSAMRSFHGRTLMALAATGQPEKHEPFQPMPEGFRHVIWNDPVELEKLLTEDVGGVILESVQGEGGVNPADVSYLQAVAEMCRERGILVVFDEIQTGLGRTGDWFGFQHAGIEPDIVTIAKGVANGMPVGAMWARDEVAAAFGPGDHGSTYAGQPLALSAARATLAELEALDAPRVARQRESVIRELLLNVKGIDHVRGRGLLLGIEIKPEALNGRTAGEIARACLDRGLILNGVTPTALRVAPPFIVTNDQLVEGAGIIADVIAEGT